MIDKIEYWWRHNIVYPVLRKVFCNPERSLPIDLRSMQSILILRYDRIGDMIVTTPILKGLRTAYPHLRIGVVASIANAEIIRHNRNVDRIHILPSHWWEIWKEIRTARAERYDVVLNLVFNRTTTGGILANMIAPKGIKIGQGDKKYKFYFNVLLQLNRQSGHMLETLLSIIKNVFNVQLASDQTQYDIVVDSATKELIGEYCAKRGLRPCGQANSDKIPYIVFNLSAHDTVRRISQEQAFRIGEYLSSNGSYRTILLHAPNDTIMFATKKMLVEKTRCLPFPEQGTATLLEIAALIDGAAVVITPDTSIIHFASAAHSPLIGFYTSMQDMHEWLPLQVNHKIILSEKNQPTSSIPIPYMIEEIDKFIRTL